MDYYIDRSKSIRKAVIIYKVNKGLHSPIMYIHKPKWITQEEFDDYLDRMEIRLQPKHGLNENN